MPGQAWHHGVCDFRAIPVYRPLDVPEPTTWGESGGDEAITLHDVVTNVGTFYVRMVGDNVSTFVDHYDGDDGESYWMAEHGRCLIPGDVVDAMNFLERSKK
jgi:hypothetical protein